MKQVSWIESSGGHGQSMEHLFRDENIIRKQTRLVCQAIFEVLSIYQLFAHLTVILLYFYVNNSSM